MATFDHDLAFRNLFLTLQAYHYARFDVRYQYPIESEAAYPLKRSL